MTANLLNRRFVDRFYAPTSNKDGYTIPVLGLDAAGKTTLLQRLKIGKLVEIVPRIGLNLEMANVRFPEISPNLIKMPSWDVGGCGKRFPPAFLPHWTQTDNSDALIWLVDSCERERLSDSVEEFLRALRMLSYPNTMTNNRHLPILILATKQDVPNAMSTSEVESSFPSGPSVFLVGTTLNQSLTDGPFPSAFKWLLDSVENSRAGKLPAPSPTEDRSLTALEIKLESWLQRAENGPSTARFLRQFENVSLPEWDHYTLVRIVYSMLSGFGRQKGRELILQGVQKYTALSEQTRGRPFHVTITYFWIQVVHFAISGMPPAPQLGSDSGSISYLESMLDSETIFDSESIISELASDWSLVDDDNEDLTIRDTEPVHDNEETDKEDVDEQPDAGFIRFLLTWPILTDDELWTEYYSRELMMSSKAKARMVLPDKQRLPNLVGRDVILTSFSRDRA
ncbi:ADP-ribosylation factor family-domain-containing protein [Mycena capillaripes]|nr:ADP-ribosylation factor family-domain-containing protein [Mycena capillaripes]